VKKFMLSVLAALIVGCDSTGFRVTYTRPSGSSTGTISVTAGIDSDGLPEGTVSLQLRGFDAQGRQVFEANSDPTTATNVTGVPDTVKTVQVRALGSDQQVLSEQETGLDQTADPTPTP